MTVVDTHAHLIPPVVVEEVRRNSFRGVAAREVAPGRFSFTFPNLAPSAPTPPAMHDVEAVPAWLDSRGIDAQLIATWTDLFGYTLEDGVAREWNRFLNEAGVRAAATSPRLVPLATIPLQNPTDAASELAAAKALGCRGAMIGTAAPGLELDDRRLDPVWEAAAGLSMPLIIHPIFLHRDSRLAAYRLANTVGRSNETTLALARFLYGGALARHPALQIVVVHGGAALPILMGRLTRNFALDPEGLAHPVAGMRRLFLDSIVLDPAVLRFLVETLGSDRFVLGSDFPFPWEPDPCGTVRATGLDEHSTGALLGGNAQTLFGLTDLEA